MSLPPVPAPFEWRQSTLGPLLECLPLRERSAHGFTTRLMPGAPAVQPPPELWTSIADQFGVDPTMVVRVRQVHGRRVMVVRPPVEGRAATPPGLQDADAIAGAVGDAVLTVRVADCMPLLLAGPSGAVVAAVHAGWRGTAAGIIGEAVRTLHREWHVAPGTIVAVVGPSIGPCCYQVGPDVAAAFAAAGWDERSCARWFRPDVEDRLRLDLWTAAVDQFVAEGVPAGAVHASGLCTACHLDAFYSYRVEGPRAGRLFGLIRATHRP